MRDFLQLTVVLALLIAVFGSLERLWGLKQQKLFRKAFGTDLIYYFLSGILPRLILVLPLSFLARGAHHFFAGTFYQWTAALPLAARVILAAVVGDIGSYWGHRWSHEIPWLWRFHSVHHSAEEMDWLINTRAHPVDLIFTRLCGYVPMYILGLAQPLAGVQLDVAPLIVVVLGTFWGYFIHANLRWRFGWFEYLVSTPHFHHWHHNSAQESINKNYSAMLPCVDAMFGTLHLPPQTWPQQYGTVDPVPETLAEQLLVLK